MCDFPDRDLLPLEGGEPLAVEVGWRVWRRSHLEGFPLSMNRSFDFAQDDGCGERRGRLLSRLTPAFQALPLPKEVGKKGSIIRPSGTFFREEGLRGERFPPCIKKANTKSLNRYENRILTDVQNKMHKISFEKINRISTDKNQKIVRREPNAGKC